MKKKKANNTLGILAFIGITIYLIFLYKNQNTTEKLIIKSGSYLIGIVTEKVVSKSGGRRLNYKYRIINKNYKNLDFTTNSYYSKYSRGDTIIIKFLPDVPEKSMIIEDKEYKSCYGIPPADGWKELPQCE